MNLEKIKETMEHWHVDSIGGRRYFSILIPLIEKDGQLHILYEQRSRKMKAQPGDICFPGGRMEKGETPLACALRETYEEVGIKAEDIQILGQFDTMYEIANITLHTFVGVIDVRVLEHVNLNEDEVENIFTVPYDFFLKKSPLVYESQIVQKVDDFPYEETGIRPDYKWRTGKNTIPIYKYNQYVIWGLTGRITKWFVEKMEEREKKGV